jgi:virulence factor Mce-like protein
MATRPPTATRILIAVGFALSCFGLALFLWIAFGGPVPLKPESYRIEVPFEEATQLATESDVRISGVSVGKVKSIELADAGSDANAEIELDPAYAPIPSNTQAQLRQKTLLGETYVELTPGDESAGMLEEGGALPKAQVADSVQLDEIFRAFDEPTRAAFRTWMQGQSAALRGRGDDLSLAIASLDPFSEEANRALRLLDSQRLAVQRFVRDGGEVFDALSERQGQLRGLIARSNEVFATTADRNQELEETFRIFPAFERESRLTLTRLSEFARNTDPLIQQLRPAARELSPTLIDLGRLAPDLEAFFNGFANTIAAGKRGLPATQKLIDDDLRPLLSRIDPYFADFNSLFEGLRLYRRELAAFFANLSAAANQTIEEGGTPTRDVRTLPVLAPDTLAGYPQRLQANRTNPYVAPEGFLNLSSGLLSYETRQCATGVDATLDPADANQLIPASPAESTDFFDRIIEYVYADIAAGAGGVYHADDLPAPGCTQQPDFQSIGEPSESTQYLHTYEQGAP